MSRCFPYPPPGYTLSRAVEEPLIESIELQKERAKAREKRKEKKKEKKEKRKEKRRKEKKERMDWNLDKYETSKVPNAYSILENSEQLEKSGLTEEHEQPNCVGSTSSDSAQNSSKRKIDSSPTDGIHSHGNVVRIRFKSKKKDVSNLTNCCSTSGRTEITVDKIASKTWQETFRSSSDKPNSFGKDLTLRSDEELMCSTSGKNGGVSPGRTGIPSAPVVSMPCSIQGQEQLLYRNLIEDWTIPHIQDACFDPDDLDWLLHGKNLCGQAEKRQKCENAYESQLHAHHMPEVDLYALPYTIPF